MKQRLASRIARLPRHGTPWPRVLATAALVVVVVGVGLIYRWSQTGKETVPVFTDDLQERPENIAQESPQSPPAKPDKQDLSGYAAEEPQTGAASIRKEISPSPRADRRTVLKSTRLPESPVAPALAEAEQADAEHAIQTVGRSEELIVWGSPVQTTPVERKEGEATLEGAMLKDKAIPDRMAAGSGTTTTSATGSHIFIVEQRSQETRLRGKKSGPPGATAAGLARSGDTVYVTLHLDPLLSAAEMRTVFVRECPPDSFQIVLPGGTVIGYRTPTGFLR